MKRTLVRAATPAILFCLAPLASVAGMFGGCIPSPDISGLPPYDGGGSVSTEDGAVNLDATTDGTIALEDGGNVDTGPVDSAIPLGNIVGVVVDYTQGNGQGVVPNAVVSVSVPGNATATVPSPVTAGLDGTFAIANVPAGQVEITVSKPTAAGGATGTAFSSTNIIATVNAGATLSVFPVLHEGCYQVVPLTATGGEDAGDDAGVATLASACGRSGAYAAMSFNATSFNNPITNTLYTGATVRVEMIPLAYPSNEGAPPDLSWALGLPGQSSPADLLGAAEYRVIAVDPGAADDGLALVISAPAATNGSVKIAVPVYQGGTATAASFSPTTGKWGVEATVTPSAVQMSATQVSYVTMAVPHLTWWAATTAATATGCVTGTVQNAGAGVPNVFVHAVGTNVLGSATAVTGANGAFCLDIQSGTDGGVATIGIAAGYASGGVAYVPQTAATFTLSGTASGTCASQTGCTVMSSPITLAPSGTCAAGNLLTDAGGWGTLQIELQNLPVNGAQSAAGILSTAYLGEVTPAIGTGAFCAVVPPGSSFQLQAPGTPDCLAPQTVDGPGQITVGGVGSQNAPFCGAAADGGCQDAGVNLLYSCPF